MPEKVTISHRGARYEIGIGRRYYAIWAVGAPRDEPVDRWPETPEGWSQAWARFSAMETPGTIAVVPRPSPLTALGRLAAALGAGKAQASPEDTARRAVAARVVGAGFLGIGVALGVAGLFPDYFTGQSLASASDQLVPHAAYIVTWAAALALVLLGGARTRAGALLGCGLSAVTLGLLASDLAIGTSSHAGVGAGMIISLFGWLACAIGSVLALRARQVAGAARPSGPARPRRADAGAIALLTLCAIGAGITFLPSWDSYVLTQSASSSSQAITAGDAFQNPGTVIFADLVTVIALVAVAVLAALWRPARQGAALLGGAIVAVAAQAISALIQVSGPASPEMFGISAAQAQASGLAISSGVTGIFWVYVVFLIAMAISCAWLLTAPSAPGSANPGQGYPVPGYHSGPGAAASGTPGTPGEMDEGSPAGGGTELAEEGQPAEDHLSPEDPLSPEDTLTDLKTRDESISSAGSESSEVGTP